MNIKLAIDQVYSSHLNQIQKSDIAEGAQSLSYRYRSKIYAGPNLKIKERWAYLFARLPATYAAIEAVLDEVSAHNMNFTPTSMLDIGAGPGTASWVCAEQFPSLSSIDLIEKDHDWIVLGQELARLHPHLKKAHWYQHNITSAFTHDGADLVIASYALQELPAQEIAFVVGELWKKTQHTLVIVEPGTPKGFAIIRSARKLLINAGAHVVAPCSHENICPMQGSDWCHFKQRLARSRDHQQVKQVSLGYEDEKFSYVIVSRSEPKPYYARVIRAPIKRTGHIILDLCTASGLTREIVGRSEKAHMKEARKTTWGAYLVSKFNTESN